MGKTKSSTNIAEKIAQQNTDVRLQTQILNLEKDFYYQHLVEAKQYLQSQIKLATKGNRDHLDGWIICGSGLANLANAQPIKILARVAAKDIPHWFIPQVQGHGKQLIIADIKGQLVAIQTGRGHVYDTDFSPRQLRMITLPLIVAKGLNINWMIITNAAGVLRQSPRQPLAVGDVIVDFDFKNDLGVNPLIGPNDHRLGQRFPSKGNLVSSALFTYLVQSIPRRHLHLGIYTLASNSPLFEGLADLSSVTYPATIKPSSTIFSCVGMSFAMEAIVMQHFNQPAQDQHGFDRQVPYLGITAATNIIEPPQAPTIKTLMAGPNFNPNPTSHQEVIQGGSTVEKLLVPAVINLCSLISAAKTKQSQTV